MRRVVSVEGVVYYESERLRGLGVRHAFSTRVGGVSVGAFASLNLGNPGGCPAPDAEANLAENYRRLTHAAGLPGARASTRQVHGCGIALLTRGYANIAQTEADAIVTDHAELTATIRVADCAAVLAASADGRVIALIHAGWRGVVAGVIPRALETMASLGKHAVAAAVFPCIQRAAFEVGPEVVEAFRGAGLSAEMLGDGSGKGRADVPGGCLRQLVSAGIEAGNVDVSPLCTFERRDEFYSHRRDGLMTGRMALLAVPASASKTGGTDGE